MMIELDRVSKRYGPSHRLAAEAYAVRDVTLKVPRGATWAMVGPNGAGKSTLLGLVLGFLRPTDGTVRIDGKDARTYVRRHGAGYLPERFSLPGEWPVRDALRALARLDRLGREAKRIADEALDRFGLVPHAEKLFAELSRGLRQRVGVAQALLAERPLVVLDEPTEGLDPLWRIQLRDAVGSLHARGTTVLVASHDLAEVERIATAVTVLEGGTVRRTFEAAAHAAIRRYALRVIAGGEHVARAFPGATTDAATGAGVYHVEVADAAELSGRLAALLDAGAVVSEVRPFAEGLEDRVRRTLGGSHT
ncbi:MAG: ABC transporter ATP-binding protein [Longimicrobiales bacterium]